MEDEIIFLDPLEIWLYKKDNYFYTYMIWTIRLIWSFEGKNILINKIWGGETVLERALDVTIAVVHTKLKAPDPIRTPKLSGFRHG